ncbi:flippase [Myxococcota bacterium]|nr:flippase [Myxococcota bacterium]
MSTDTTIPVSSKMAASSTTGSRVVRNTAMLGAGHAVRLLMGSATTILITDLLGTQYGLLIGAQRFVDVFRLVMLFGLNTLLIRGVARADESPGTLLGSIVSLRLALGCVFVLLTSVTAIASGYMPEHRWLVWVFIAVSWGYVGVETLTGFCEGHERMDRTAPLPVTRSILMLTGTLIVAHNGSGLHGIAVVFLITQTLQLALSFALARPLLKGIRPRASQTRMRSLLRDGPHYMAVGLAYAALRGTSVVLLTRLAPSAETAMFGAALNFVDLLFVLPLLAQRAFLPVFSRTDGAKESKEATTIAKNGVYAFSSVLIPAAAGLHMLADSVVALYPSGEFTAAAPVLRVLALGIVFTCMSSVSATFLTGRGRVSDVLRSYALALPLQAGLCLWTIGPLGAVGAAIATVSAQGVLCLGLVLRARREGMQLPGQGMFRHVLAAGVMMVALVPFQDMIIPVSALFGVLVYTVVLLTLCPANSYERSLTSRLRVIFREFIAREISRRRTR